MEFGEKRRQVWYAVLDVPAEVRHIIGKKRLIKSTKTRDEAEASVRIPAVVAAWKAEIKKARGAVPDTRDTFWHDIRKEFGEATKADREGDGEGMLTPLLTMGER